MALSYRFCKEVNFLSEEGYYKPLQLTLEGMVEEAECKFIKSNKHPIINFNKGDFFVSENNLLNSDSVAQKTLNSMTCIPYEGHIDLIIKQKGKIYGTSFTQYLQQNDFLVYYLKELNYFLFTSTKTEVVDEFVREISATPDSGVKIVPIEVNFETLQPLIPVITGVWFGEMNKSFLKSAGYFGNNVDRSEEFKKLIKEKAKINNLMFNYHFNSVTHTIAVTQAGAVILYNRIKDSSENNYDNTTTEIQLAIQIFTNFILPGIKTI